MDGFYPFSGFVVPRAKTDATLRIISTAFLETTVWSWDEVSPERIESIRYGARKKMSRILLPVSTLFYYFFKFKK